MTNRISVLEMLGGLDFLELLNQVGLYRNTIVAISEDHAKITGDIEIFWNEQPLEKAFSSWKTEMAEWLSMTDNSLPLVEGNFLDEPELSHIKSAGVLLKCLTQTKNKPIEAAYIHGILPEDLRLMIESYPNEYFCFVAMYQIFNFQQFCRGTNARYDFEFPPLHFRYARSMCYYLFGVDIDGKKQPRNSADLYMIFKTMDLFGLIEDYSNRINITNSPA